MDAFVCNARRDKIQDMNINMTTIPEGLALAIIRPETYIEQGVLMFT